MSEIGMSSVPGAIRPGERSPIINAVAEMWERLRRELADPYHPERHYMRGPGPKWHEKHPG